jgi:hypothetical protein
MAARALTLESFRCLNANCLRFLRRARAKWPAGDGCESVLHFRIDELEQGGMLRRQMNAKSERGFVVS